MNPVFWTAALPEIVLCVGAMVALIWGVLGRRDRTEACTMISLGTMLLAGLLLLASEAPPGGLAFGGLFLLDGFAVFTKLLVLLAAALGLVMALDWNRTQKIARFEFPVLILLATAGMLVMLSAADLMTLYLGLELQSLALYVVAAFARDEERSTEAGLKYFILGALSSGLLLYGSALVYGFAGTTSFEGIATALAGGARSQGLVVGLVLVAAGLAFKTAAVPFHMWTPDVYEGAPTSVTAFFAVAPKVAAIGLMLRVFAGPFGGMAVEWRQLVVLMSIGSMVLGAFAAIGQQNIKRLMAYSSIGHVGYALMGLAAGGVVGLRGTLIYLAVYVMMNAGAFAAILCMRRQGRAVERVDDLAGIAKSDPGLALALAVFMFSMAGIPPLAGFFSKLYVFLAALQEGLVTLAVIGVLASVVSAYYYLRIIKVMFFDELAAPFDPRPASLSVVLAGTGLFTVFFFVSPARLVTAAETAAVALMGGG